MEVACKKAVASVAIFYFIIISYHKVIVKCRDVSVIKTDLSDDVVTKHEGMCEQDIPIRKPTA